MLQARLDELGKAGWFAIVVMAFWAAWPIGLLMLVYLVTSGRLHAWWLKLPGQWLDLRDAATGAAGAGSRGWTMSSGNKAFDDYRKEMLRRLEEEQREFQAYLEHLRHARDKAEFDQFMAERQRRTEASQATLSDRAASA